MYLFNQLCIQIAALLLLMCCASAIFDCISFWIIQTYLVPITAVGCCPIDSLLFVFTFAGYEIIKKIGEGTFSEVVKTQSLKDGKFYACKTMKQTMSRYICMSPCEQAISSAIFLYHVVRGPLKLEADSETPIRLHCRCRLRWSLTLSWLVSREETVRGMESVSIQRILKSVPPQQLHKYMAGYGKKKKKVYIR